MLAAGLLVAGLGVSWLAAVRGRRAARRTAPARGELSARVTDLLAGAADLHAFGAQDGALARSDEADQELTRLARMSAAGAALGSGLSQAVAGLTLWGVLILGVAAVGSGSMSRVPLAVITLTALAAFEAVTALPAAAVALGHARASAVRVGAVLDAPDPVTAPATPRPLPGGPLRVRLRGARCATSRAGRWPSTAWTSTWTPAAGWRWSARAGPASPRWPPCCCGSATWRAARPPWAAPTWPATTRMRCAP